MLTSYFRVCNGDVQTADASVCRSRSADNGILME